MLDCLFLTQKSIYSIIFTIKNLLYFCKVNIFTAVIIFTSSKFTFIFLFLFLMIKLYIFILFLLLSFF